MMNTGTNSSDTKQFFGQEDYPVLLFDTHCLVCDGFVRFIINRDKKKTFKFSGLQSTKAIREIQSRQIPTPPYDTVVLLQQNKFYTESDAVIKVLKHIHFPGILTRTIRAIPRSWRNKIYTWVAKNRYRFYAERNACPLPDPSEADRFV